MSISPSQFKERVVFFDIDGTLYPYRGSVDHVHVPPEEYIRMGVLRTDPYSTKLVKAPETMKALIESIKDIAEIYVLGQMESTYEYHNKLERIKEDYPAIDPENVIGVSSNQDKARVMAAIYDKLQLENDKTTHPKLPEYLQRANLVLIDDTPAILHDVGQHGFDAIHVSEFMP